MNLTRIYINLSKAQNSFYGILATKSAIRSYSSGIFALNKKHLQELNLIPNRSLLHLPHRTVASVEEKNVQAVKQSLLSKVISKIPFVNVDKSRLGVVGYILYESVADKVNYSDFFDEFSLPDTFYSWFTVTELHIWLLTVRCMVEDENGRYVRNKMIEALWTDVGLRVKKIGAVNPSEMRMQVKELSEQFQASLIAYDEGLQTDDTVLAGALWRRMYQQKDVDPEHLEGLIKYIRRQIRLLDNVSKPDLFSQKHISWGSPGEKS